jgi:hypothetical protein
LLTGLVTAVLHHQELRHAFQRVADPGAEALKVIFQRAVSRGEIAPGLNVELVASLFPALVFYRLILAGEAPTARFANLVIKELILPLALASTSGRSKLPAIPPGASKRRPRRVG